MAAVSSEIRENIDTNSLTWLGVTQWAKERLEDAQTELEMEGLDHTRSEALRREIMLMKTLINLPDPPAELQSISAVKYS